MSRRKPVDNSTAVSLFPFLAVLLCTMGALLVVLVAVSRAARESALRKGAEQQHVAPAAPDAEVLRELQTVKQFSADMKRLRRQAEQRLRDDQLRLGQLEEHMRRLQDQLAVLQAAAAELDAMEEEHYDDRRQAQREIERLQRLIDETRTKVDELREKTQSQRPKYALIPYEGPNGTFRRPIYVECRKNELILQPEGVRVTRNDLRPPFGPGNPLASALRAARDYYVRLHPAEGQSRDTEPYPLLVVRPEGLLMYNQARRAIQSSDFEFGFELVEDDWDLTYPVADPKLASVEQQAIDLARIRQQALAAAAPRAYRQAALGVPGQFAPGEEWDEDYGLSGGSAVAGVDSDAFVEGPFAIGGADPEASGEVQPPDTGLGEVDGEAPDAEATPRLPGPGARGSEVPNGSLEAEGDTTVAAGSTTAPVDAAQHAAGTAGRTADDSSPASNPSSQIVVSTGSPPDEEANEMHPPSTAAACGRDWALERKKPNAIPIRRTIEIQLAADQVAILADDAKLGTPAPRGRRIAIPGDTVGSLDSFVEAVREHIAGWGIAGEGLYWRPVLILHIEPGAERRAEDLARLLKNSGLELRSAAAADNQREGEESATR